MNDSNPIVRTWAHDPYMPRPPTLYPPFPQVGSCVDTPGHSGTEVEEPTKTPIEDEDQEAKHSKKIDVGLYKVKPCHSYPLGKCIYGERCIYAHFPAETRTRDVNNQVIRKLASKDEHCKVDPNKFKVRMCDNWMQQGTCPYVAHCMFAHGSEELRSIGYNQEVARRMGAIMMGS